MHLLDSLLDWLVASTARGSLLIIVVLVAQAALRRVISPQWRFALWLPVILVLLAPRLPQSPWSVDSLRAPALHSMEEWFAPAPAVLPQRSALPPIGGAPTPELASITVADLPLDDVNTPEGVASYWLRFATAVWLLGAVALVGISLGAYARAWRRIARVAAAPSRAVEEMLDEATDACGLHIVPRLVVSPAVASPAVTGLYRPTLLLPAHFPDGLTPEESQLVIRHELMHVKRWDLPVNWLLCLVQALHWFNPIVWLAITRVRADRENACDAQVLELGGGDNRAAYGNALLKMEAALSSSAWTLGFIGIFERQGGMRKRIRAIAGYQRSHPATAFPAMILLAALTLVGATRAQEGEGKPNPALESPAEPVVAEPAAETVGSKQTYRKLREIVIPRLQFREVTVSEALATLKQMSVELDKAEIEPSRRGVRIVLNLENLNAPKPAGGSLSGGLLPGGLIAGGAAPEVHFGPKEARLTLSLADVPLDQALRYVTGLTDLKFFVAPSGVVEVVNKDAPIPLMEKEWMLRPSAGFKAGDDARQILSAEGVNFAEGASATLSADGKKLTVMNTPENLDLIDQIVDRSEAIPAPSWDLRKKLRKLIIPRLEFQDATISEAIEFLKRTSLDLDTTEKDPAKRGVNIVLKGSDVPKGGGAAPPAVPSIPGLETAPVAGGIGSGGEEPRLTISLSKIPLGEALRYMAKLSGRRVLVGPYAVELVHTGEASRQLVTKEWRLSEAIEAALGLSSREVKPELIERGISFPPGSAAILLAHSHKLIIRNSQENLDLVDELIASASGEPEANAAQTRAASLQIPSLVFRDATLREIVDFIRAKAVEADPDRTGVNVVLDVPVTAPERTISLSMTNVSVWDALRQVARMAEVELTGEAEAVRLHAPSSKAETRR